MPMYSFQCPACEDEVVKLVKMEDRDSAYCDRCGHRLSRKIDCPGGVWAPTSGRGLAV